MICGSDNMSWNIFLFELNMGIFKNNLWNIVSPTKHCYALSQFSNAF